MNLFCLSLLSLILYAKAIFLNLDRNEERCISRELTENEYFAGFYLISGEDEQASFVYIRNEAGVKLWELEKQKSGTFSMNVKTAGNYYLCALNRSKTQVVFSFEFTDEKKEEETLSIRT